MGILGKIFGTDDAINKTIDLAARGIDALVYTDEEKSVDAAKSRTEARTMIIKWMESTQGQNLARRFIALSITCVWLLQYLMAMIGSMIAVWVDNPDKWIESVKVIGDYAENMNGAMMLILAFYFAAPHMGDIAAAAMDKFSGRKG